MAINFRDLLDYIEGVISTEKKARIEKDLEENPDDLLTISGIKALYEIENMTRADLEDLLSEMKAEIDGAIEMKKRENKKLVKKLSSVTNFSLVLVIILVVVGSFMGGGYHLYTGTAHNETVERTTEEFLSIVRNSIGSEECNGAKEYVALSENERLINTDLLFTGGSFSNVQLVSEEKEQILVEKKKRREKIEQKIAKQTRNRTPVPKHDSTGQGYMNFVDQEIFQEIPAIEESPSTIHGLPSFPKELGLARLQLGFNSSLRKVSLNTTNEWEIALHGLPSFSKELDLASQCLDFNNSGRNVSLNTKNEWEIALHGFASSSKELDLASQCLDFNSLGRNVSLNTRNELGITFINVLMLEGIEREYSISYRIVKPFSINLMENARLTMETDTLSRTMLNGHVQMMLEALPEAKKQLSGG